MSVKPLGEIIYNFGDAVMVMTPRFKAFKTVIFILGKLPDVWSSKKLKVMLVRKAGILEDMVLPTFLGIHLVWLGSFQSLGIILDPTIMTKNRQAY